MDTGRSSGDLKTRKEWIGGLNAHGLEMERRGEIGRRRRARMRQMVFHGQMIVLYSDALELNGNQPFKPELQGLASYSSNATAVRPTAVSRFLMVRLRDVFRSLNGVLIRGLIEDWWSRSAFLRSMNQLTSEVFSISIE
jgi:hypothetical protein